MIEYYVLHDFLLEGYTNVDDGSSLLVGNKLFTLEEMKQYLRNVNAKEVEAFGKEGRYNRVSFIAKPVSRFGSGYFEFIRVSR